MAGAVAMEMANAPKFGPSTLDAEARRGRVNYKERKESIDLDERDEECNWNMHAHSQLTAHSCFPSLHAHTTTLVTATATHSPPPLPMASYRLRDNLQRLMDANRQERIAIKEIEGTAYNYYGETLIALIVDPLIERASLTYWRHALHRHPNVIVPDILLSNSHTLKSALERRYTDWAGVTDESINPTNHPCSVLPPSLHVLSSGERERRMIVLRNEHFSQSWPPHHVHFNWLRLGVSAGCTHDLQHLTRSDVMENLHHIHEYDCAYKIKQIFDTIRLRDSQGEGPPLHTSRAQALSNNHFWDLCVASHMHLFAPISTNVQPPSSA